MMRINVACGATLILEMERQHLVRWPACASFVTFIARHGHVCARQSEPSLLMSGNRKCRTVKILHGVAAFTTVMIRSSGKLPFVDIFVTIQAGGKLHIVEGILACLNVALIACHVGMFAQQRVFRGGMLFHAK